MNKYEIEAEITTEQHPFKRIEVNLDLEKRREYYEKRKISFEFQEVGLELEKWFGKKCWFVFYQPEAELSKVKEALRICKEKNIRDLKYFLGILKN